MSNESPLIGWKDEKGRKVNGGGEKPDGVIDGNHHTTSGVGNGSGDDGDYGGDDAKETTPMQPKFVPAQTQVRFFGIITFIFEYILNLV